MINDCMFTQTFKHVYNSYLAYKEISYSLTTCLKCCEIKIRSMCRESQTDPF